MSNTEDINVRILELKYQCYASRAHTVFSVCGSLLPTIILGVVGIFLALYQADKVLMNRYYITFFTVPTILTVISASAIALTVIFESRKHRNNIEEELKKFRKTKKRKK